MLQRASIRVLLIRKCPVSATSTISKCFGFRCYSDESGPSDPGINGRNQDSKPDVSVQSPNSVNEEPPRTRVGFRRKGFAAAFEKFRVMQDDAMKPKPKMEEKEPNFATILRNSKYIQLGAPEGKIVVGRIVTIAADDLYIDFGGKFHCVCKRPQKDEHEYYRGAFVRLRLGTLELSTRFLGADRDLTLLEADGALVGSMQLPARRTGQSVPHETPKQPG